MRIRQEAAAKRDLPEAIAVTGTLQDELHAALDVLLRRAQEADAVRPEVTMPDIIILLKGPLASRGSGAAPRRSRRGSF